MKGKYRLAQLWHAYRARSEGNVQPPTPWTGPHECGTTTCYHCRTCSGGRAC